MRKLLPLWLLAGVAMAQPPPAALVVQTPVPTAPIASASVVGNNGQQSYSYWVVANYPSGAVISQPATITQVPNVLTSGNYVNIGWNAISGATNYDVIRLIAGASFNGACSSCAVATGVTGTNQHDNGGSLSGYSISAFAAIANGSIYLNNRDYSTPEWRKITNGVDTALSGGGGGGCTPAGVADAIQTSDGSGGCQAAKVLARTAAEVAAGMANLVTAPGESGNPESNVRIGQNISTANTGQDDVGIGDGSIGGNSGTRVNGIGNGAAEGNTGNIVDAMGYAAAFSNTGDNVVAVGQDAALSNTASDVNAIGLQAGDNNTGQYLDAVGDRAGYTNTGTNVAALGNNAAALNEGNNVVALGYATAYDNTGNDVVAIGNQAAGSGPSGFEVVAIGTYAAISLSGESANVVGIGEGAASNNSNVSNIIAIGYYAGEDSNGGSDVIAIGNCALCDNGNQGADIIAIGTYSLEENSTGTHNYCFGYLACNNNIDGANNYGVGYEVGYSNQHGTNNIYLGCEAGYSETGSNKLYIDNTCTGTSTPLIYGDFSVPSLTFNGTITANGNSTPLIATYSVATPALFGDTGIVIGPAPPDLSGEDGPANALSVICECQTQINIVNYISNNSAPEYDTYRAGGSEATPANLDSGDFLWGMEHLGWTGGGWNYLAADLWQYFTDYSLHWVGGDRPFEFGIAGNNDTGPDFGFYAPGGSAVAEFNNGIPVSAGGSLATINLLNLGLSGAILTGGKSCTINATTGLWTCV